MNSSDEKLIEKYLTGDCTENEMMKVLQWIEASEDNREELLKLRIVSAKSSFIYFSDSEHVSCSYEELQREQKLRKRIENEITRKIYIRFTRFAASILLLIGLSVVFYKYTTDWRHPQSVVVSVAANEQIQQIMLEDSSLVWLSAGSRIEYPKRFARKERIVKVEGKVFFEVTEDADRPFYVKTETFTVKVLGTSFEVSAPKYSQTSDVTLVKGQVEILDYKMETICELQPGQQFEIDKLRSRHYLNDVDAKVHTSWYGGKLEFDGQTFGEIIKVLERHYDVKVILDSGIAKDKKLVGSLSFQKDIYEMMKTMELVVPIKYLVQTNTVVYIQSK